GRDLLRAHRLGGGEQHGFHGAHVVRRLVHAALTQSGSNGAFWSSWTLPSRASSSAATKLEASADLRNSSSSVSGRKDSSRVHSSRVPTIRSTRCSASSSVITGRRATTWKTGSVRARTAP